MDEATKTGDPIVTIKNRAPVTELSPAGRQPNTPFDAFRGSVKIPGDNMSPLDKEWDDPA